MRDFVDNELFIGDFVLVNNIARYQIMRKNPMTFLGIVCKITPTLCQVCLCAQGDKEHHYLEVKNILDKPPKMVYSVKNVNVYKITDEYLDYDFNDIDYILDIYGNNYSSYKNKKLNLTKQQFGEICKQPVSYGDLVLICEKNKFTYGIIISNDIVFTAEGLYYDNAKVFKINTLSSHEEMIRDIIYSSYKRHCEYQIKITMTQNIGDVYTNGRGKIYYLYLGLCTLKELVKDSSILQERIVSKVYNGSYHFYLKFEVEKEGLYHLNKFKNSCDINSFLKALCDSIKATQGYSGVNPELNGLVGYKKYKKFDKIVEHIDLKVPNEVLFVSFNNNITICDEHKLLDIMKNWEKLGINIRAYKLKMLGE